MRYSKYYTGNQERPIKVVRTGPIIAANNAYWKLAIYCFIWFWPTALITYYNHGGDWLAIALFINFVWIMVFGALYVTLKRKYLEYVAYQEYLESHPTDT